MNDINPLNVNFLSDYQINSINIKSLKEDLDELLTNISFNKEKEILKTCFSLIDLTSLYTTDSESHIKHFVEKVNELKNNYKEIGNVAAVCVYPSFVKTAKDHIDSKDINIASVSAGFPHSQTMMEIKVAETMLCIHDGADEIDIVLNIGNFLDGKYVDVAEEIREIKESIHEKKLKVILETGILETAENIYKSSIIAMEAGADFIKTSTGKLKPAATPFAAYVMCKAILDFYKKRKKMVGIKVAGGISSSADALLYYHIVYNTLGKKWINKDYFRIGASRLANAILTDYYNKEIKYF